MESASPIENAIPGAAPELRLILLAIRVWRGTADAAELDRAVKGDLDWAIVVRGLERHGLVAMLAPLLAAREGIPPAAAEALKRLQSENAVAALGRIRHALEVCRALDEAGIRYLVIKGIALSVQLYGDAASRGGRDLDILVAVDRMGAVDTLLTGLGYARPEEDRAKDVTPSEVPKELGYVHRERANLVEVHSRLTDNAELLPWDFETLWAERESVTVAGRALPAMPRHRLAPYLIVHGAKSGWSRLIWLLDVDLALDTPEATLAAARPLGLEGVVRHAFSLLHAWFGRPLLVPEPASRQVRALDALAARFHRGSRWYEQPGRRSWRRFWQGSVLSRSIAYLIKPDAKYWRRQLAIEAYSPADRTLVKLPPRLTWLYPLLRPFGWLIRRVRR